MLASVFAFLILLLPVVTIEQNTNKDTEVSLKSFNAYDYIIAKSPKQEIKIEPGESFYTLEQKRIEEEKEQKRQEDLKKLYIRHGRSESYTGHGEAKRLYLSFLFRDSRSVFS